jgi:hypothetical protein
MDLPACISVPCFSLMECVAVDYPRLIDRGPDNWFSLGCLIRRSDLRDENRDSSIADIDVPIPVAFLVNRENVESQDGYQAFSRTC